MSTSSHSTGRAWPRLLALAAAAALCLAGMTQTAAAKPAGYVTYRLGDDVYRLDAHVGARPVDVSARLDALSPRATDEWLNASPNGRWLLTSTGRFGCGEEACLARVDGSLRSGEPLRAGGELLHSDGFSAISSRGDTVVYPQGGDAHTRDLWVTRLTAAGWTAPQSITAASPFDRNTQPAISSDGKRVLFDCGAGVAGEPGTAICSVATTGGPVTVVMAPDRAPGASTANEVHHADFAPNGDIVFEADWHGEQVWRLPRGARHPVRVSRVPNDNSPCVLPDGRIASLYLDRPGNRDGAHEIRIASAHSAAEILTGLDVVDIGIGCG
jgi:hypothetical protein